MQGLLAERIRATSTIINMKMFLVLLLSLPLPKNLRDCISGYIVCLLVQEFKVQATALKMIQPVS